MRRIAYPLIWLAVTVAAVLIASAAVSSVRDQVTDTPTAMLPPTTIAVSSTESLLADPVQTDSPTPLPSEEPDAPIASAPTTSTTTLRETSTTAPTTATTTTTSPTSDPEPAETSTTTTSAPSTTTTTAPTTEIRSYELIGGSVSVEIGDDTVRLAGASPKPGFTMDVESSGPEKVEVEFHNDDHESHFSGKYEDGRFEPSIDEGDEEDD